MLTVARREIRSSARRPVTYWARCVSAGVAAVIIAIMMFQATIGLISGHTVFMAAYWLAFFFCLLEGIRLAATSIVEERVEGTLGLLLLTNLRGGELLLGKFAALAFFSLQTLLALTPVLALSLLLGGVSGGEVARAALALCITTFGSLALGLVISSVSREPSRAMIGSFLLFIGGTILCLVRPWPKVGPTGTVFSAINPLTPALSIADLSYSQNLLEYWLSILFTVGAAALLLWLTSRNIFKEFAITEGKNAERKTEIAPETPRTFTNVTHNEAVEKARWFDGNPIEWLTIRNLGLRGRTALPFIIATPIAVIFFFSTFWGLPLGVLLYLLFAFFYSMAATKTLSRARQTGELEVWLTTPLGSGAITAGILAVMRKVFIWPALIVVIGYIAGYFRLFAQSLIQVSIAAPGGSFGPLASILYLFGTTFLSMAAYVYAVPYVALWISLKAKNPTQATIRTFLWVSICPWLLPCVPKSLIFIPLALIARDAVKKILKTYAVQKTSV